MKSDIKIKSSFRSYATKIIMAILLYITVKNKLIFVPYEEREILFSFDNKKRRWNRFVLVFFFYLAAKVTRISKRRISTAISFFIRGGDKGALGKSSCLCAISERTAATNNSRPRLPGISVI